MVEKITNLKLTKPDDFEDREWDIVLSRKNRLLAITDWTQSVDCNLFPSNKVEWMIWRDKLRSITRTSHPDKDSAKVDISTLEAKKPKTKFKPDSDKFKVDFHYLDISSLDATKQSMRRYAQTNIDTSLSAALNMSVLTFTILYTETVDFTVESGILEDYPVLYTLFVNSGYDSIDAFTNSILDTVKSMRKHILESELQLIQLREAIERCDTLDDLIPLVDELNGYRY